MKASHRLNDLAFSLVELSIVLVILGLLIGGILGGKSLIHAAELRSVSTQQAQYVTAVQSFKEKYFYLPGDMPNASQVWGLQSATPATCTGVAATSIATCDGDGDGDGLILRNTTSGANEYFRFWQHLANAQLISGSYSGIRSYSLVLTSTSEANSPKGKIGNGLWFVGVFGAVPGVITASTTGVPFVGEYGNAFVYTAATGTTAGYQSTLTPEDLWNIDSKTDDGMPATGKVVAYARGGLSTCTDAPDVSTLTAKYLLTSADVTCAAIFRKQF